MASKDGGVYVVGAGLAGLRCARRLHEKGVAATVLRSVDNFTNGTISVKFKTIGGEADRASGILFNVKPNGDWLAVRYNDTENNVALWEFHNGIRRNVRFRIRASRLRGSMYSLMDMASMNRPKNSITTKIIGNAIHHQMPETMAEWALAQ